MGTIYDRTITVCSQCGEIFYHKKEVCDVCGHSFMATKPFIAKIEVLSGPMDGLEFQIEKSLVYIGRDQEKDVALPLDFRISRNHACLSYENNCWWLEDMGSRNGTFVEGKRIKSRVALPFNSIFRVGRTLLRLKKIT